MGWQMSNGYDDFVVPEGQMAGCLERETVVGSEFPVFEDRIDLYSRSEWRDMIEGMGPWLDDLVMMIRDQGLIGSCTSQAAVAAYDLAQIIESGH